MECDLHYHLSRQNASCLPAVAHCLRRQYRLDISVASAAAAAGKGHTAATMSPGEHVGFWQSYSGVLSDTGKFALAATALERGREAAAAEAQAYGLGVKAADPHWIQLIAKAKLSGGKPREALNALGPHLEQWADALSAHLQSLGGGDPPEVSVRSSDLRDHYRRRKEAVEVVVGEAPGSPASALEEKEGTKELKAEGLAVGSHLGSHLGSWVADAWSDASLAHLEIGDLDQALYCIQTSLRLHPNTRAPHAQNYHQTLARVYLELGRLDLARASLWGLADLAHPATKPSAFVERGFSLAATHFRRTGQRGREKVGGAAWRCAAVEGEGETTLVRVATRGGGGDGGEYIARGGDHFRGEKSGGGGGSEHSTQSESGRSGCAGKSRGSSLGSPAWWVPEVEVLLHRLALVGDPADPSFYFGLARLAALAPEAVPLVAWGRSSGGAGACLWAEALKVNRECDPNWLDPEPRFLPDAGLSPAAASPSQEHKGRVGVGGGPGGPRCEGSLHTDGGAGCKKSPCRAEELESGGVTVLERALTADEKAAAALISADKETLKASTTSSNSEQEERERAEEKAEEEEEEEVEKEAEAEEAEEAEEGDVEEEEEREKMEVGGGNKRGVRRKGEKRGHAAKGKKRGAVVYLCCADEKEVKDLEISLALLARFYLRRVFPSSTPTRTNAATQTRADTAANSSAASPAPTRPSSSSSSSYSFLPTPVIILHDFLRDEHIERLRTVAARALRDSPAHSFSSAPDSPDDPNAATAAAAAASAATHRHRHRRHHHRALDLRFVFLAASEWQGKVPSDVDASEKVFGYGLGYRHMCRLFSGPPLADLKVLQPFDAVMRMDTDSFLLGPVEVDPLSLVLGDNSDVNDDDGGGSGGGELSKAQSGGDGRHVYDAGEMRRRAGAAATYVWIGAFTDQAYFTSGLLQTTEQWLDSRKEVTPTASRSSTLNTATLSGAAQAKDVAQDAASGRASLQSWVGGQVALTAPEKARAGKGSWDDVRMCFATNFFAVDLSWWRSPLYRSYFTALEESGGFYRHRWGDACVQFLAVATLLDKRRDVVQVHRELPYWHQGTVAMPETTFFSHET